MHSSVTQLIIFIIKHYRLYKCYTFLWLVCLLTSTQNISNVLCCGNMATTILLSNINASVPLYSYRPWFYMHFIIIWNIIIKHMTIISNQVIKPPLQSSTPFPGFQCLRDGIGIFILAAQRKATSSSLPAIIIRFPFWKFNSQQWSERSCRAMVALQVICLYSCIYWA